MNIGGLYRGIKCMDTQGSANLFGLVAAEHEDSLAQLGWKPYHVEKGFKPTDSTVTLYAVEGIVEIMGMSIPGGADQLLVALTDARPPVSSVPVVGTDGIWNPGNRPPYVLMLSGDQAQRLMKEGWTKDKIRKYFYEHFVIDKKLIRSVFKGHAREKMYEAVSPGDEPWRLLADPDCLIILRVGSDSGKNQLWNPACTGAWTESIDKWR
jgi:hypothetical protein